MYRVSRGALAVLGLLAWTSGLPNAVANDFPTQARVEFVFDCMAEHGGSNYTNLYHCSCQLDKLAKEMSYDTFLQADTYEHGRHATGERGAILREGKLATSMRRTLEKAKAKAAKGCFLSGGTIESASK